MSNFKPVKNFWFWCQKVLPLVYDDSISYYEVLCKMSEYLNQVIDNVNALPDIIDEAVKEYIESGEIQKVLNEMLQNFNPINVKNPPAELTPAKGDGETDDTAALQAMIEYGTENNLPMIFPAGVYRVTSLNVTETAYFWGVGDPTIFKAPNSENALITVAGDFTAFNMNFNGNISGNIAPADIITGTAENISLAQCNFAGCVSCVDVGVSGILDVTKCHFSNYTDYAIHAKGTGRLMIDGIEVDNVANSGAMRFMKIDTSNSIVKNLTSLANVPIGVEITGDFNSVEARIPNCENPVNDVGQNNSFEIIGQNIQKKVTGKMAYAANVSEENMGTRKVINAEDIVLNPTNPITYKEPQKLNDAFNYVQFKTPSNTVYNVLVEGNDLESLGGIASFYNNKKIFILGDSISNEELYPPNWVAQFRTIVGNGCTVVNNSASGRTMGGGLTTLNGLESLSEYDYVIVFLGTNDYNHQLALGSYSDDGFANTCILVLTKITNLMGKKGQIVWITPPYRSPAAESILSLSCYRNCISSMCRRWGGILINGERCPGLSSLTSGVYLADGVHFRPEYAPIFAKMVAYSIASGGQGANYDRALIEQIPNASGVSGNIYYSVTPDGLELSINVNIAISNTPTSVVLSNYNTTDLMRDTMKGNVFPNTPMIAVSGSTTYACTLTAPSGILTVRKNDNSTFANGNYRFTCDAVMATPWNVQRFLS